MIYVCAGFRQLEYRALISHTHSDTHSRKLKHHPFESEEEELAGTDSVSPVLGLATAAAHVTLRRPMPKHSGLGQPARQGTAAAAVRGG